MLINSIFTSCHAYEAHAQADTVLDLFTLATVCEAIHQELNSLG
jgi:hypothetical protein